MTTRRAAAFYLLILTWTVGVHAQTPVSGDAQAQQTIQMVNVDAELRQPIDTALAKPGDTVTGVILKDIQLNNGTTVPKGSLLVGSIESAAPSVKKSDSSVVLLFDKIKLKSGSEITVKISVVHVKEPTSDGVNPQETYADRPGFEGRTISSPHPPDGMSSASTTPVYRDMRDLTVQSVLTNKESGTLVMKRKNLHLPRGTRLEVSMAILPADAILVQQ